jgi:cytoskeletal protein CcmA (bactofilin family)
VVIHGTGKVFAEVFAATLVVDEGGVLEGEVHMTRPGNAPAAAS